MQQPSPPLADPFARIFTDRAEADWAFDLLRDTARRLDIQGAYDPRFAITLARRSGRMALRLNFGGWLILGFRGPWLTSARVEIALLAQAVNWDERFKFFPFAWKDDEPKVRSYQLPLEIIYPMTSDLQAVYDATLDFIAYKFQNWKRASQWQQHKPEIAEALFNPEKRERLFVGLLNEPDQRYERHLTAFYQDVSEEPEAYETKIEETVRRGDEEVREAREGYVLGDEAMRRGEETRGGEVGEAKREGDGEEMQEDKEKSSHRLIASSPPFPLLQLAADTSLDEAELARWVRAIERKGQAILYGPPGTGKTFVAEKLAAHLVGGGDGFWELVQFHPAYAYEDFIQGIRPHSEGDHLTYPLMPGRFLDFCARAGRREGRCVLIVDEINRANLSRVFGELMYLLEYRNRAIPLAGGGLLQIPANVRLIGTMNTADRSIALVDHALRRRFAFIALYPNYDVLRRYHQKTGFPVESLIDSLTSLNRTIGDRHYEVGVAFFLRPNLAEEIEDIWRLEIEPYLEEYFFDRPEQADNFRWDKVKIQLGRG